MRAAPFVVLLLLLPLLPSASADHVYSHRYVVYARVVDEQDRPVPGVPVTLDFPETVEGTCNPQPKNATEYFGNTVTRNVSDANGYANESEVRESTASHTIAERFCICSGEKS